MLGLPQGKDQNNLKRSTLGQNNDFAEVVYSIIRKYLLKCKTSLTTSELDAYLDAIAHRKNEAEAENILLEIFKKCSAEDIRWVIRIILKDLRLGIDGNGILNCYHKDGAQYYASNNNLRKVVDILYDDNVNVHELDIVIFEPFRPMLSKKVDQFSFKKNLQDNKLFYVENKFDGERFQIHMKNNIFKYFSRNGYDFTASYGPSFEEGILTPKLKDLFEISIQSVILDGEMMLWDKHRKKYGSKGIEVDVKKLREEGRYQPCFCAYDIILFNEEILTNRPLRERVKLLRKVFQREEPGILVVSEIKEVFTYIEIVEELNRSVKNEEEGIIIKDPKSIYKYSDRNSGWFKMKLEYFQDTMNDLDVILMGGQYASVTSDQLNSFIVGVKSVEDQRNIYLAFAKVSSGLTDRQLEMINEKLKTLGKSTGHSSSLCFGKEKPNYYIEPEDSLLFEIRATELVRSNESYKTSYTLRFPRVMKIRDDKPVEECLTINELLELTSKNKSVIKLNKNSLNLEDILIGKKRNVKKKEIYIPNYGDRKEVCDIFRRYKIHVLNGDEQKSKSEVENNIYKAGGEVYHTIDEKVDIVLVGTYNDKAKEVSLKRHHYDVISTSWLFRVLQDGNLLGYQTDEIYCLGTNPSNCLSDEVDRYGDSYMTDATPQSLRHCFSIITNLKEIPAFNGMIEMTGRKNYESYTAYFDKYQDINNPESETIYNSFIDELEFRYYNGNISQKIDGLTNLIIFLKDGGREVVLLEYLRKIDRNDIELKSNDFLRLT
ncbi:hypothetical protein GWI33_016999 [Rhynchophorus ferrugineus]|uniref:DNA ligase 4 n=1 Tax=Rhynchophorus ferrugineus TaxID=354439 RepID=A0A834M2U2_RHYFE|nr:hypothetical protein GWI33_016999 [Rhynchophorus ferrugineus]